MPLPKAIEREIAVPEPTTFVRIENGATIAPEPITWLWSGWLAAGKLHLIAGVPGTGKTTVALAILATITRGGRFPDDSAASRGSILIWSGEDGTADTVIPRLMACGADMSRIHIITGAYDEIGPRSFDPSIDLDPLVHEIEKMEDKPVALLIDPVVSAVSGNSHKNAEVRRDLQPLVDLGDQMKFAVVGITHFTKGTEGRNPVERVTGSLAFGALARIVLAVARMPDTDQEAGSRLLVRAKSNIGPDGDGFRYDLNPVKIEGYPGVESVQVCWGESEQGSAHELLAKADSKAKDSGGALDLAVSFLREQLKGGPVEQRKIERRATEWGHSWATVRLAKEALDVRAEKRGFGKEGKWWWSLPKGAEGA